MTDGSDRGDVRPDGVYWDRFPFKTYSELFPNLPTGTFRSDWASLQAISYRPARPTILATDAQLATLQRHYPLADPSAPPWDEIKADLIAGGIALSTVRELMAGDAITLLSRVSKPINPEGYSAYQWTQMRSLWKNVEPYFHRLLNTPPPDDLSPSLINRDWRAELPYMEWAKEGGILIGLDDNGNSCLRVKDISEVPEEVRPYLTTSICVSGGVRINEYYLPFNAPPLADYLKAIEHKQQTKDYEDRKLLDELHERIADPDNAEPIPLSVLRERPGLAAWLNGENPGFRPTMAEAKVLRPAFIERRRRIAERALLTQPQPQVDGPWSEADAPNQWARRYGISWDTLKRRFDDGKIRFKKLSSKSYQIHVDDLPAQK